MIVSPPLCIEKSLGEGRFTGLAWSFLDTPDREGDVILPSAFEVTLKSQRPVEIRVDHRKDEVAGEIDRMEISDRGLEVEGQIDLQAETGRKAYDRLRSRDLGALSIGFTGKAERSGRTRVFTEIDLEEISLCREPMNAGSRISAVKSWGEVDTVRDLERLFHDIAGMPNRLARKSAALVWPALHTDNPDAPDPERIAAQLARISQTLRNEQ